MSTTEAIHVPQKGVMYFLFVYIFILSAFHIKSNSGFSRSRFQEFQHRLMRCCPSLPGTNDSNLSACDRLKKMFQEELVREGYVSSKSYRYTKKLWKSIKKVASMVGEENDPSLIYLAVNATKAEKTINSYLSFKRSHTLTRENDPRTAHTDVLTRLELIIPYYTYPQNSCRPILDENDDIFISLNEKNISRTAGIVPHSNILVFRLPLSSFHCSGECGNLDVTVKHFPGYVIPLLKQAMLLEYYNINQTNMDSIHAMAQKQEEKINSRKEKKRINQNRPRRSLELESDFGKNFCQLHNYRVNVQLHLNMRGVAQPRYINLGQCKGQCNALHLDRTDSHHTARSVFINLLVDPPKGHVRLKTSCVPDKMKAITVLWFNGGILGIKLYPSATIHSCRCV